MLLKIATFNVNSIKARLNNVDAWLKQANPDIILLQEIKCQDSQFPVEHFKALGFESFVKGQKAYNGVAILSKYPATLRIDHLPGDPSDEQARYLEIEHKNLIIASLYLPNGNPVKGQTDKEKEKFPYKLAWMKRLKAHIRDTLLPSERAFILGGDYNICPHDKDCYDVKAFEHDALLHPDSRGLFREIVNLGVSEAFDTLSPDHIEYSYWDYMKSRFDKDQGLRIDHFLLSPEASILMRKCCIDR
ncbi:MAG: exodeoxyribonuclease III, partial [Pseudomonadota bacterium]